MRDIAGTFIALYSLLMSYAVYFIAAWDNKGSQNWWDKSTTDWATLIIVGIITAYCWFCAAFIFSNKVLKQSIITGIGVVLFVHLLVVFLWAQGEAIYFLGAPVIPLLVGFGAIYYLGRSSRP